MLEGNGVEGAAAANAKAAAAEAAARESLKVRVVAELRRRKIKLWLPPYVRADTAYGGGGISATISTQQQHNKDYVMGEKKNDIINEEALSKLAKELLSSTTTSSNFCGGLQGVDDKEKDGVINALLQLQAHALEKLASKSTKKMPPSRSNGNNEQGGTIIKWLDVKVLGMTASALVVIPVYPRGFSSSSTISHYDDVGISSRDGAGVARTSSPTSSSSSIARPSSSVAGVERVDVTNDGKLLRLLNPSPGMTVSKLAEELKRFLRASNLRLIHKGRNLVSHASNVPREGDNVAASEPMCLADLINGREGTISLLCLVSGTESAAKSNNDDVQNTSPARDMDTPDRTHDQRLVDSIRRAACKVGGIHGSRSGQLEITDQHGRHVAMTSRDRRAFITALGLHRLGRQRLGSDHKDGDDDDDDDESSCDQKQNHHRSLSSAMTFLLEADAQWTDPNTSTLLSTWSHRVDNYGLLQLDIAWTYLRLECLDSLPDVLKRLDVAESVLRKQVHSNFVTLALVQSDMGNMVPPLCAVFVRLFLLQGVAYRYAQGAGNVSTGDCVSAVGNDGVLVSKSRERLDWAHSLCQSLRSATPEEGVGQLVEAMGVSRYVATCALRKSNGIVDAAAEFITRDREETRSADVKRQEQRRWGLCANGMDYVDLDMIPQLRSVLGLTPPPQSSAVDDDDDEDRSWRPSGYGDLGTKVSAGLLRLSDNNIGRAIDVYQEVQGDPTCVAMRVNSLDERLRRENRASCDTVGSSFSKSSGGRKRHRVDSSAPPPINSLEGDRGAPVDEIALATLESMGVEDDRARRALRSNGNNIELAILWLTGSDALRSEEGKNGSSKEDGDPMTCEELGDERAFTSSGKESTKRDSSNSVLVARTEATSSTSGNENEGEEEEEEMRRRAEEEEEEKEAEELLERELGQVLQDRDLEKEYLGHSLDEEWRFILRYRSE